MPEFSNVKQLQTGLEVQFKDGKSIAFEDCWLRDECRCSVTPQITVIFTCSLCYHADKHQRALHLLDIPDAKIVNFQFDSREIYLTWSDGHKSTYTSNFLNLFDYKTWKNRRTLKPILWQGPKVADKVARVQVNEFFNSVEGARRVFQSLLDYGVSLIEGVETTLAATAEVCKALGGVQHTFFGGMWELSSAKEEHADTSYTNLPLAVHNDNTYFTEAAGLQVFHCTKHSDPKGGETILVDGFFGANQLKEESPVDFDFLTTFDVDAQYVEDKLHYTHSAPVIQVDRKTHNIQQIRFNVYDRSPMPFKSGDECRNYYRSLRKLGQYYEDPKNQWQFKLTPGVVLAMDNFRVLHGRTSFSGHRVLAGSYVSRSDWLNKARVVGLIS